MAIVRNTRTHQITLSMLTDGGAVTHTIDGARENPLARTELIDGVNPEVPDDFIEAVAKSSKVAAHYFAEGWLVIEGGKAPKAK